MSSEQGRAQLDARAREGETVISGGTGGKSLEAQERLAEGKFKLVAVRKKNQVKPSNQSKRLNRMKKIVGFGWLSKKLNQ